MCNMLDLLYTNHAHGLFIYVAAVTEFIKCVGHIDSKLYTQKNDT